MSAEASQQDTGSDDDPAAAPPLAADRPFVDGTSMSAEELRAEVDRLSSEERQHVDDLREELGDSVAALASRLDVKSRVSEKTDEAVASVHDQVNRARAVVTEGAVTAKDAARQNPGLAAAVLAAVLVVLLIVVRRRRR